MTEFTYHNQLSINLKWDNIMLSHEKIIEFLIQFRDKHASQYGIIEIGLFGSIARGDIREDRYLPGKVGHF